MEELGREFINPNTGYGMFALWTVLSTAAAAYVAWIHYLLYSIDILRFFWAYWVSLVLSFLSVAGVLHLILGTFVQILVLTTMWRISRHGIESLDKHTITSIHNQNTQSNED